MSSAQVLDVQGLEVRYGSLRACDAVSLALWEGEVLGIVGESGSGKTSLLKALCNRITPDAGQVRYCTRAGQWQDFYALSEGRRRQILRSEWGVVSQHPHDGLRMNVSAGANIGERLMANGHRHYGDIHQQAQDWLAQVEIDPQRVNDKPVTFSGGMQQRLQIARNLVTQPRLLLMDEPTGGLDVSVQARLLDLLRTLVGRIRLSVILVTHDLAVARMLSHRLMVMQRGRIVESGLTDQVLDDPQHPYTQLLVSSVLQP